MSNEQLAIRAVELHCALFNAGDRTGWLNNFSESPTIEEPVGSGIKEGREALEQLFEAFASMNANVSLKPLLVIANWPQAAAHVAVTVDADSETRQLDAIEIFTLDESGKVAGIRTFVDPAALAALVAST